MVEIKKNEMMASKLQQVKWYKDPLVEKTEV